MPHTNELIIKSKIGLLNLVETLGKIAHTWEI
ncbi:hypothetical protein Xmir_00880 [Xenorhabdus miraniensis]|uniref:Uncharacterized protein n=1 Tax=Xenorhabdus miraniensis TaxID=351674 RepID=A0A2D0JUJ0_9GAMM|nr:hypothetical protein Xmir_00880 [Xenorhabdus miraniensis]